MITTEILNGIPGRHQCLLLYNPKQEISTKTNKNDMYSVKENIRYLRFGHYKWCNEAIFYHIDKIC